MRTSLVSLALLGSLAGAALAQDLPNGVGVVTPSGSVFTTEIGPAALDTDDYVFEGYPGMVVTATVKQGKGSALSPEIEIIRLSASPGEL